MPRASTLKFQYQNAVPTLALTAGAGASLWYSCCQVSMRVGVKLWNLVGQNREGYLYRSQLISVLVFLIFGFVLPCDPNTRSQL